MMQRSETFGYRREEVLGQPLLDRLVPPRLHDDYRRALPVVSGTDETAGLGRIMELAAIRKNGEEFPIELSVSAFRLDDHWHAVGVMSDLSSRKWYEAELEERARLSQMLAEIGGVLTREESVEAMLQGCMSVLSQKLQALAQIWVVDPESQGTELKVNSGPDGNSRRRREAMVIARVTSSRSMSRWRQPSSQKKTSQQSSCPGKVANVVGFPLAHGSALEGVLAITIRRPLSKAVITALETVADEVTLGIVRLRLINNLGAARQAAEAASRAKERVPGQHEPRDPHPDERRHRHDRAGCSTPAQPSSASTSRSSSTSADSLLTVINDILDFSKIEAGKLELEPVTFGLRETVEGQSELLAESAHGKGLELACRIAPDVADGVIGDPNRLRQVLINLVGNAIKFTERGEVIVTVERDCGAQSDEQLDLLFTVCDTGVGIPPDRLGMIFEPFEQADGTTTRHTVEPAWAWQYPAI